MVGTMREIDESHVSAEALGESGRLGYEFYRQVYVSNLKYVSRGCPAYFVRGGVAVKRYERKARERYRPILLVSTWLATCLSRCVEYSLSGV